MTLLEKLKRALGLDSGDEGGTDTALTVEREAGEDEPGAVRAGEVGEVGEADEAEEADEAGEAAGPDGSAEPDGTEADDDAGGDDEPVAAGTEAAASTGSMVDEDAVDTPDKAAEPSEATTPETDDQAIGEGSGDAGANAAADASPIEELTGIGPAYGERLRGIGIATIGDLAAADAGDIAAETDISEGRANTWIERARER